MIHSSQILFFLIQLFLPIQSGENQTIENLPEDRLIPLSSTELQLLKQVKLVYSEAKTIALEQVRGKVFNWELEQEDGYLIYTIEIQLPSDSKQSREVNIDALTGKVIGIEVESLKRRLKAAKRQ